MRYFINRTKFLLAGAAVVPTDPKSYDTFSRDTKTYKSFEKRSESTETGWDRLKQMFELDEFGELTPELNSIYQAGFMGFLIGALYGGVVQSRKSYFDFMDNNQATAFKSHLDAKRKLQDSFTTNFAKGSIKWGWRVGLFTTSYVTVVTCISVYREKSSIYEYIAAGTITGAAYKINLGLRGATAGGIIGGVLGAIAGGASMLILKLSGTTMEEVRYWQHKWKEDRQISIQSAFKAQADTEPEIIAKNDENVGTDKLDLSNIK